MNDHIAKFLANINKAEKNLFSMAKKEGFDYWSVPTERVLGHLNSSEKGLTAGEARKRLLAYGKNEITHSGLTPGIKIFFSQFRSPLLLILLFAVFMAWFLGERTESGIILAILLLNALLGFYQEFKSEKAFRELQKYISLEAEVLREGKKVQLDASQLVPGEIIFLEPGDIVPADCRLILAHDLEINESSLTGESFPVLKEVSLVHSAELHKRKNCVLMGTVVAAGTGQAVVVHTSKETVFGQTARHLNDVHETEFHKNLTKLSSFLTKITIVMTLAILLTNYFFGRGWLDSFLFALALAVGITPEALPIVLTIAMSKGALRLAREKVVVKKLSSLEDLGNLDILCMDKTGTLTKGQPELDDYIGLDGKEEEKVLSYALACSEKGNSTNLLEQALWQFAKKKHLSGYNLVHLHPFDSHKRKMSAVVEKGGKRWLVVKGAPDTLAKDSVSMLWKGKQTKLDTEKALDQFHRLSGQGKRVIAVAVKEIGSHKVCSEKDEQGLTLIGYLIFSDPIKTTAKKAVNKLQQLNLGLKILSGDDPLVVLHICQEVGLPVDKGVLIGEEWRKLSDKSKQKAVREYSLFARLSPEQKKEIVDELGKLGHVVGFLGDGINDTPALKAAEIGISVDSGAGVAKEAADIILLKKNLEVLTKGVIEGRRIFGNATKYILNTVSANYGNMFTVAISSLFLKFIPLLPRQILLTNLISDAPLLAVSTDKVEYSYLKKPKKLNLKLISRFMFYFGLISSIFDLLMIAFLLVVMQASVETFRTAWFAESVLSEILIVFSLRTSQPFFKSRPSKWLLWMSVLAAAVTILLVLTPLGSMFGLVWLSGQMWLVIVAVLGLYLLMVETAKRRFFKKHHEDSV